MFGYYIEQSKLDLQARNPNGKPQGFNTSIKGFNTREEAQQALGEAEKEAREAGFRVIDSRVYEYD
ncbi:hypothetical protein [Rivularia sp. UHCC 0363]|uniref:hypothetical protein n=1 Tax=Rivularia sp. UHCC 0363 TaxID=3110244 RepID=UPI002B2160AB|nr:hypothetical protein [Rivularia sp. UHCC 0363]MEA5596505.1 hypothetical protein [Rivularia sp. UHCC 0363]